MAMQLRRVILFTPHITEMADFYSNVLGLEVTGREDGWVDFAGGACSIALHAGPSKVGARPPKLAFYAADVSGARAALLKKGLAKAGPVKSAIYGDARNVAPGWDIHYLEREFRSWLGDEEIVPKFPEKMFVKFCKSWFEKRGRPA